MNATDALNRPANELGALLRQWRDRRGKSQFDLSLDTGISQRHISFIESGRSVPSRQALMEIAQGLEVPLRERNFLLLAAGYAPVYPDAAWDAPEMRQVTQALDRMLRQHEPYPAMVMDRHWNVLQTNQAAPEFFGLFVDLSKRAAPRNLLDLIFDPAGLRPFIVNWEDLSKALLERVRREAVGRVIDGEMKALLAKLAAYSDVQPTGPEMAGAAAPAMPIIPVRFVWQGACLSYFSMVATVGTPQTIAAQELRLECMFPADDATEAAHRKLPRKAVLTH